MPGKSSSDSGVPSRDAFAQRAFRSYLRHDLHHKRGGWRLATWLVRSFPALRRMPIGVLDWPPVYVDPRVVGFGWLTEGPYDALPYEAHLQDLLSFVVRPGDVVLDIGANVGFHSVLFSRLAGPGGKVHAFEPNPNLHECLALTFGALANARLHATALSNADGRAVLFVPDGESVTMASFTDWTDLPTTRHECPQHRLDGLVESGVVPQPDMMKVDVEGAELLVFEGARGVLDREDAPIVLFEELEKPTHLAGLGQGAAHDFLASLQRPRFSFFQIPRTGEVIPYDAAPRPVWVDVLAVPAARMGEFTAFLERAASRVTTAR